jgi:hypothetical protein
MFRGGLIALCPLACSLAAEGLAARYPGDVGMEKDPAVFFADGFESGTLRKWDERRGTAVASTTAPHAGAWCVDMTMNRSLDHGGDTIKWFMPGADRVYARFYVKFSANFQYAHHFVWLSANERRNKWASFGKAGKKPDGLTYFSTGMEPWFAWGKNPPPGEVSFYAYYPDMEIDPKMALYWGNGFFPPGPGKGGPAGPQRVIPPRDRWQCWEFMLQSNSAPGVADGRQTMWVDGQLVGDFTGIRWRESPDLKVNCFWLQHYGGDSGDPTKRYWPESQTVWFDDIVVAREYIGPMVKR